MPNNTNLSEEEFLKAIKGLRLSDENKIIAYNVLVQKEKQIDQVQKFNKSAPCINRVVKKVLNNYIPDNYEEITVIVPKFLAYSLRKYIKK